MIESAALKANLASSRYEVEIDPGYHPVMNVFSTYYGLKEGISVFLKELSHPLKNLQFIVSEAKVYSLNYMHLLQEENEGIKAAQCFVKIFIDVINESQDREIQTDAADNLLLFLLKLLQSQRDAGIFFQDVFQDASLKILKTDDTRFFLFVKSYFSLAKIMRTLAEHFKTSEADSIPHEIRMLLIRYYEATYHYWLREPDPASWFFSEISDPVYGDIPTEYQKSQKKSSQFQFKNVFYNISHERIEQYLDALLRQKNESFFQLVELPGFSHFTHRYKNVAKQLYIAGKNLNQGNIWKIIFLFHMMNLPGLSVMHEETLREINRTMSIIIEKERYSSLERLVRKTFSILKTRADEFPQTIFSCVLNMGKGIYKHENQESINLFIDSVIDLGFQPPNIKGVGDDWQVQVNPAHIQNIRTWLALIRLNPKWSARLLSELIIHLTISGVYIKDTDLFPKDITNLLNSNIQPVYNLVKQLCRLFPAYFNDIGAEGALRDISTEIDEISHRKDILVHFLRKQVHVESSNRILGFMEAVFDFWRTKNKESLFAYLPEDIYEKIETKGEYIDTMHMIFNLLHEKGYKKGNDFIISSKKRIQNLFPYIQANHPEICQTEIKKAELAVSLYKLLAEKYAFVLTWNPGDDLNDLLTYLKAGSHPELEKIVVARLRSLFKESGNDKPPLKEMILTLLDILEKLQEIILSPAKYEIQEDIYKKRHFTVDIPSMYGSYKELKFDALGLTYRIENLVNIYFEELVRNIDLNLITFATFYKIYDKMNLFIKGLKVDGISSEEMESQFDLLKHSLEARGFSFTQYLDVFKGFARAVKNIINDYFNNIHEQSLKRNLETVSENHIDSRYLQKDEAISKDRRVHLAIETFFREKMTQALGLQQMDLFLSRILNTLFHQSYKLSEEMLRILLNYDHEHALRSLVQPNDRITGTIYLGNKGFNLIKLNNFHFPVPPFFIITTEVFRCREIINAFPPAGSNLKEQISKNITELSKLTGKSFGNPENPLLLSVRSGSSISQPGMMDTFLNVGITENIALGIAKKTDNPWFAWDNYRRFLQCWGMGNHMNRDEFDAVINEYKQKWGIMLKSGFSGEQMKEVALAYKNLIRDNGIAIIERPFDQLLKTIQMVLDSWESPKAKSYRKIMGISNDWGTAVTAQSMVYGNISRKSGTGVLFTHNPKWSGETLQLWGDFSLGNQGEDVVAGLVNSMPISISQQEVEMRETDYILENNFPAIYDALFDWANDLVYKRGWSPQEMEFTFEGPERKDLYLLQTRNMTIRERKKNRTFDPGEIASGHLLGNGIGVSGGALSGRIVFTLEDINRYREQEPLTPLILIRGDTVPDDILEINAANGLLTAKGGVTSHAAVVTHGLGKTCVVGCSNLICDEKKKTARFEDELFITGNYISIDGTEGTVYKGLIKTLE